MLISDKLRRSPGDLAASALGDKGLVKPADCIDTFRLFLDNLDFSSEDSDGWLFVSTLLDARSAIAQGINAVANDNERNALAMWPLRSLASDMKNNFVETVGGTGPPEKGG